MKRITIVAAAFLIAAAAFAAWGTAAPGGKVAALAGPAAKPKPKLPALRREEPKEVVDRRLATPAVGFISAWATRLRRSRRRS
jgi:hypothetical protein